MNTSDERALAITPPAPFTPSTPVEAELGVPGAQLRPSVPTRTFQTDVLPDILGFAQLTEVGRGGTGVVYRAHDASLNRDVAVKVLQDGYPVDGIAAKRFVEESRITSQLQHPGIPPVHQIGKLADGRPFLVMKLIMGRTLDGLLKERSATADRGRFVASFEQICQAVGYAHAHKVIHRDLKPLNVMVGAFGEVQVMDWGLSKSLSEPLSVDAVAATDRPASSWIGSDRDPDSVTEDGSVLGTPAFMSPEQAGGEIAKIDARSDVFSLGAVLCVILTGDPPYRGVTTEAVRLMAVRGQLSGAMSRLDGCGAEPELVLLCKRCLSVAPADRFTDANELAVAVAGFRAAAEERARQAELDHVRAEAEVREQRKRRKVQLALAASVALLLAGGGGFAWYSDHQTSERKLNDKRAEADRQRTEADRQATAARLAGERDTEQRLNVEQARQGVVTNLELAVDLRRQYKFKQAKAALAQAAKLAEGGASELLAGVRQAQSDLAFVVKLDDIRYRKWIWIAEERAKGHFSTKIASPEYRVAFMDRGLDLQALAPTELAKRIASSGVKAEIVSAVDDWALYEADVSLRDRLLEIARKSDPGVWTDRLRDPALWKDKVAVTRLVADVVPGLTSAPLLNVLAELMSRNGLDPIPLLAVARVKHPTDFELAFALGLWHARNKDGQQIGPYEAARALRPENLSVWNNLGIALRDKGDVDGSITTFTETIKHDPNYASAHYNLGVSLKDKGDVDGAIAAWREAIKHDPKYARAHNNLGVELKVKGDVDGAIAAWREALKHDPNLAQAHFNLGAALRGQGDADGAIAAWREAIKHDPKYAKAHNNLGIELNGKGDVDGAISALREAIKHDPKYVAAHYNLGIALKGKGDVDGAITAYTEAIKHDSTFAGAHSNLGALFLQQKKYLEAIACARDAIKINSKSPNAHAVLGLALRDSGDIAGARVALTEAARLDPKRWGPSLSKLPPAVPVAPVPREVNR